MAMMIDASAPSTTASNQVRACLMGFRPWPEVARPRRPFAPERFACNEEPAMADLLGDPIMARLMASDGVAPEHLCAVLCDARDRLGAR